jgi:hypothetical protein
MKAGQTDWGKATSDDAERRFLRGPRPRSLELREAWRIFAECVRGFRRFHFVGPCVTVFGSARLLEKYSYAFVAMPGGIGTLDEIFETSVLVQTGKMQNFPLVLIGKSFWTPLADYLKNGLLAAGTVDPADVSRWIITDSPAEAVELIRARALSEFGLTYGPRAKRHWWLRER